VKLANNVATLVRAWAEGEKNTRSGGWIVFTFSTFSPTEVTNQILNAADKTNREREKKNTKQLYRFLPQIGSSPVPLALPRRVH